MTLKNAKSLKLSAYTDGASRGNPGPASIGVVIFNDAGEQIKTVSQRLGITTNNVAEYYGLIFAMQEALIMGATELQIFTDSELITKQYNGEYKVREESMKLLFLLVSHLKKGFNKVSVTHVPREQNKLADEQANKALDDNQFLL